MYILYVVPEVNSFFIQEYNEWLYSDDIKTSLGIQLDISKETKTLIELVNSLYKYRYPECKLINLVKENN